MVQRKGKKGIVSGGTIKKHEGMYWKNSSMYNDGEIAVGQDDGYLQSYNLNKSKNWEIIEAAPKRNNTPITREQRMDKSSKRKKDEFKEHLKSRGLHKEPPKPNPSKKPVPEDVVPLNDEIKSIPTRDGYSEGDEKTVIVKHNDMSRNSNSVDRNWKKDVKKGEIVVVLPTTEKDIYLHQSTRKKRGSFDYWDTTPFRDVLKNDIGIDFKAGGFLPKV